MAKQKLRSDCLGRWWPSAKAGLVTILFGLETRINFSRRGTAMPCPYKSISRTVIEPAILNRTVLGLVVGSVVLWGAIAAPPAAAQTNQSDITGPNVSDITGPNVSDITGPNVSGTGSSGISGGSDSDPRGAQGVDPAFRLDPQTAETAGEFAEALEDAYARCIDSTTASTTAPRRFARGTQPTSATCITPECAQLNQLMAEVKDFLARLDRAQAEVLRRSFSRLW